MSKQWFLICPSGHKVVAPVAEIHDTPDGLIVALTCDACGGKGAVFSFVVEGMVNWEEAKKEAL